MAENKIATRNINIGWEVNPIQNSGVNSFIQVTRDITIRGLQISCAMACAGNPFGSCQTLFVLQICPSMPAFTGRGPDYMSGGAFDATDWGKCTTDNPNGLNSGGGFGGGGYLMSVILKTVSDQAVNQSVVRNGLARVVPAGSYLLAHMDQAGCCSSDIEMQGVIEYD